MPCLWLFLTFAGRFVQVHLDTLSSDAKTYQCPAGRNMSRNPIDREDYAPKLSPLEMRAIFEAVADGGDWKDARDKVKETSGLKRNKKTIIGAFGVAKEIRKLSGELSDEEAERIRADMSGYEVSLTRVWNLYHEYQGWLAALKPPEQDLPPVDTDSDNNLTKDHSNSDLEESKYELLSPGLFASLQGKHLDQIEVTVHQVVSVQV